MNHFQVKFKHPVLGEYHSTVETTHDKGYLYQNIKKLLDGDEPHMSLAHPSGDETIIPAQIANEGIWTIRQFLKSK